MRLPDLDPTPMVGDLGRDIIESGGMTTITRVFEVDVSPNTVT